MGRDDIFLFFGWFREVEKIDKIFRFKIGTPNLNVIFGFFQIDKKIKTKFEEAPYWAKYHSHLNSTRINDEVNTIYIAKEISTWNKNINGAKFFNFSNDLVLTKGDLSRSKWELPEFFGDVKISYHDKKSRKINYFQSASIGQEFVIQDNKKVEECAKNLVVKNIPKTNN